MWKNKAIWALLFLPFFVACKSHKRKQDAAIVHRDPIPADKPLPAILKPSVDTVKSDPLNALSPEENNAWTKWKTSLDTNIVVFNELSATADLKVNTPEVSVEADLILKMKNDSLIWFTGRVMGIEGVRGVINKDSIFLVLRLQRQYVAEPIAQYFSSLGNDVSIKHLQQIMLGQPGSFFELLNLDSILLSQRKGFFSNLKQPDYLFGLAMDSTETNARALLLRQQSTLSDYKVEYADRQLFGGKMIPALFRIWDMTKTDPMVEVRYNHFTWNVFQQYPFKIPENYARKTF